MTGSSPPRPRRGRSWQVGAVMLLVGVVAVILWHSLRGGVQGHGGRPHTSLGGVGVGESALSGTLADANVVICVIDAARADHVGCYGYARETTPNMDRLASTSVIFERHYAPYPQTKASTASLFTAQHADTHQAVGVARMSPDTFTMDRGLRQAGYICALSTSNPWVSNALGRAATFDTTRVGHRRDASRGDNLKSGEGEEEEIGAAPEALVASFSEWLTQEARAPFFAYVHFMPPHHPYVAPSDMEVLFEGKAPPGYERGSFPFDDVSSVGGPDSHRHPGPALVNRYDANLRYADKLVGDIVDALAKQGLLERTLLIITSDHGEALGEHGYNWHPACPFDEALHIPLLMRFPDGEHSGRVPALSQTLDIMPTVYDLLGLPLPENGMQGSSLAPLIAQETEGVHEVVFARTEGNIPCYVVRDDRYALLLYSGGVHRALYDTVADPGQRDNILDNAPDVARRLEAAFREFAATQPVSLAHFVDPTAPAPPPPRKTPVEMSGEMRKELEALGYLK